MIASSLRSAMTALLIHPRKSRCDFHAVWRRMLGGRAWSRNSGRQSAEELLALERHGVSDLREADIAAVGAFEWAA